MASTYNRYACRCSSCRRTLNPGDGVLCGTVSEFGGWIVTCRSGFGCNPASARVNKAPKRAEPVRTGDFIADVLASASEADLIARGWDVAAMKQEAALCMIDDGDRRGLRGFDPSGSTSGRMERVWCDRMEAAGLLRFVAGDCSGERCYSITEAGRREASALDAAGFDPSI